MKVHAKTQSKLTDQACKLDPEEELNKKIETLE